MMTSIFLRSVIACAMRNAQQYPANSVIYNEWYQPFPQTNSRIDKAVIFHFSVSFRMYKVSTVRAMVFSEAITVTCRCLLDFLFAWIHLEMNPNR